MRPAALLWAWLCPTVATLVRMMMVRMLVRLLSLLAGRPLLSRCRAAVLSEGGDRRRQNDAGKTHTKKCANHASLRCHIHSLYHDRPNAVPGVRRRNWPASLRRNAGERRLRPSRNLRSAPASNMLTRLRKSFSSRICHEMRIRTAMLTSLRSTTE